MARRAFIDLALENTSEAFHEHLSGCGLIIDIMDDKVRGTLVGRISGDRDALESWIYDYYCNGDEERCNELCQFIVPLP